MAIERLQPREEQDQQLDQIRRGASSSEKQGVRDHCMLQYQRYDLYQQSKGKELALAEGKDPLNGVAVGEDGKPMEKQIVLRDHYDKDHPGLAGGAGDVLESTENICKSILELSDKVVSDPATRLVVTVLKTMLDVRQRERENQERAAINKKLDQLIGVHYKTASDFLDHAVHSLNNKDRRNNWIVDAIREFTKAANVVDTSNVIDNDSFIATKSRFYAGVCYGLIEEPSAAMKEYEKAYKKGHEQWEQSCQEIERLRSLAFGRGKSSAKEMTNRLGDFYQQFLEPLKKLIENRPPASDNAASTSYSTVGEFQLLTLNIPGSKSAIRKLYASGENHRLAGREKEAIDDYSRVLALAGGNHAEALASRGAAKSVLKDYEGALDDMNDSLKIEQNSAFALSKRGEVKNLLGDYPGAMQDLNDSLKIDPNYSFALKKCSEVKSMLDDYPGAVQDLNEALKIETNSFFTLERWEEKPLLDSYLQVWQDLNEELKIDPNSDFDIKSRDVIRIHLREYLEELQNYSKDFEIDPNSAYDLNKRGYTKYVLGDYTGALEDFNKLLKKEPNSVYALEERGKIKYMLDNYTGALKDFNKLLKKEPNSVSTLKKRGQVKYVLGDYTGALEDFNKLLKKEPNSDAGLIKIRGQVKYMLDNYTGALQDLNEYLKIKTNSTSALGARGKVYQAMGKDKDALEDFDRALALDSSLDWVREARNKVRRRMR